MRRRTTSADEVRLVDTVLAPIREANARAQERSELEERLDVIDELLSADGQEQVSAVLARGALRIAGHRAAANRRLPTQADQDAAIEVATQQMKERRGLLERERTDIKQRLHEIRRAERTAAGAPA
jgi:hypothetical protein